MDVAPHQIGQCNVHGGLDDNYVSAEKDAFDAELKKCLESCGTGEDCPLVFTGISQGGGTVRDSSVLLKDCRVCPCQLFSLSFSLSSLSFSRRQLPSLTGPSMTRL